VKDLSWVDNVGL